MNEEDRFKDKMIQLNNALGRIDRMNTQIEINTRKLNDAIKEMRGLVGFVRPNARKNAWYGEELEAKGSISNDPERQIDCGIEKYGKFIELTKKVEID